ncbi:MAG: AMP-binding protein, partial [Syntrophales bacterium LBB04]|nr:AMP-binding protein [Syntrophales bacterium LBB04]
TSGTTGISKLAMLSHRNITEMARNWIESLPVTSGDNWISISPPAWIVDQMCGVGVALLSGMTVNFPEMPDTIDEDFREIGPSIIITSSRFWEDLASRIMVKMDDAGFIRRKLFAMSVEMGKKVVELQSKGEAVPCHLNLLLRIAAFVMWGMVRYVQSGSLKQCLTDQGYSGAANSEISVGETSPELWLRSDVRRFCLRIQTLSLL